MLTVRKYLLAGVASIGLLTAGATSGLAGPLTLTLNPEANNSPAGGVIDPTTPAFQTNSAVFGGGSLLDISNPGPTTAFERGNINVTAFQLNGSNSPSNVNSTGHYQIFATFFISASGIYSAPTPGGAGVFSATAVNQVSITLYAIPSTGTFGAYNSPTPVAPFNTACASLAACGVTGETGQFIIGTATLINDGLASAIAVTNGTAQAPSTTFSADLLFTPATGTSGNFFQSPMVLNFEFSVADAIPPQASLVTTQGSNTFISNVTTAGGSINFLAAPVPEPASLSLLGMSLLVLGVFGGLRRRRNQKLSA